MLLLDERNITPGYVVQNGQIISRNTDSYKESVGFYTFKKKLVVALSEGAKTGCLHKNTTNLLESSTKGRKQRRPEEAEIARKKDEQRKQEIAEESQKKPKKGTPWWIARPKPDW